MLRKKDLLGFRNRGKGNYFHEISVEYFIIICDLECPMATLMIYSYHVYQDSDYKDTS